jgi:hypothetical protein
VEHQPLVSIDPGLLDFLRTIAVIVAAGFG